MRKEAYIKTAPEMQAVSADAIRQTIRHIREEKGQELHSFLMLRNGKLIWEEYFREGEADRLHPLYSVSKSFTSTAIGIAQAQGLLSLDDKLYDFFPEHAALCDSDLKRKVTLRHMLMMGSGFENHEGDILGSFGNVLVGRALEQPVIHEPGTVFDYYTLGTYLAGAAFSRVYPAGIHAYLRDKLFAPMGFGQSHWNTDDGAVPMGGFGLFLTAYDLTRFGQLYLQEGVWEGQQLVPCAYAREATSKQISNGDGTNGWSSGYGYQFWRNHIGGYRADGMFGQFIIILPDLQTVVVMTSNMSDMGCALDAIGHTLIPSIG